MTRSPWFDTFRLNHGWPIDETRAGYERLVEALVDVGDPRASMMIARLDVADGDFDLEDSHDREICDGRPQDENIFIVRVCTYCGKRHHCDD